MMLITFILLACNFTILSSHGTKRKRPDIAKEQLSRSKKIDRCHSSSFSKPSNSKDVDSESKRSISFIYDKYTASRGMPKMLEISCLACKNYIMDYQKDGPGRLLRCYLDRIRKPDFLAERKNQPFSLKAFPSLSCAVCKVVIGVPMIYRPENRPAYRMEKDKFIISSL